MKRSTQVVAIAQTFVGFLARELSAADYAEMIRRNKEEPEYLNTSNACASHDFCDANMPMAEAFEKVMGHELDASSDEDVNLWNDAWDYARRHYIGDQR